MFYGNRSFSLSPILVPEAVLPLVSTKNYDLWPGPTTFRV